MRRLVLPAIVAFVTVVLVTAGMLFVQAQNTAPSPIEAQQAAVLADTQTATVVPRREDCPPGMVSGGKDGGCIQVATPTLAAPTATQAPPPTNTPTVAAASPTPKPAATATMVPTPQPAPAPMIVQAAPVCPSDPEVIAETGLTRLIDTRAPGDAEWCKWNFQLASPVTVRLPADGLLTAKMADGQHVLWVGPVNIPNVLEGTLRLKRGYPADSWVHKGPCAFAAHEFNWAENLRARTGTDIRYSLGNFSCPGLSSSQSLSSSQPAALTAPAPSLSSQTQTAAVRAQPALVVTTKQAPVQAQPATLHPMCEQAPTLIGGTGTWKRSPDDPTKWVYSGSGWQTGKELMWPGFGYFDYWKNPGEEVKRNLPDDNATFNCPRGNEGTGSVSSGPSVSQSSSTSGSQQCNLVPSLIGGTGSWKRSADDPEIWIYTGTDAWQQGRKLNYPGFGFFNFHGKAGNLRENIPDDNSSFHCS